MIKHIFSFLVLGFILYILISVYSNPDDFCYYEGQNDVVYNDYDQFSFYVGDDIIKEKKCPQGIENVKIKDKNKFIYFLAKNDAVIGLFLFLAGLCIFTYKKRKHLYKNKT